MDKVTPVTHGSQARRTSPLRSDGHGVRPIQSSVFRARAVLQGKGCLWSPPHRDIMTVVLLCPAQSAELPPGTLGLAATRVPPVTDRGAGWCVGATTLTGPVSGSPAIS